MKRLMMLLVFAALVLPANAYAQPTPVNDFAVEFPAAEIGEGWAISSSGPPENQLLAWSFRTVYTGPEGASIVISTIELGASIGAVSLNWNKAQSFWETMAEREIGASDSVKEGRANKMPEGIATDAFAAIGTDPYTGQEAACALYGSLPKATAITVLIKGTVNGLTGVAATDYVAGLYFAALSGQ